MPVATSKQQITYIVFAHADDEYSAWSLIHKSTANYPVFCMLTRGEQTSYCPMPAHQQPGEKERPELPASKGSTNCVNARLNSFRDFLGNMAAADATLEDPISNPQINKIKRGLNGFGVVSDRDYLLFAGSRCALLYFNLGDGTLTDNEGLGGGVGAGRPGGRGPSESPRVCRHICLLLLAERRRRKRMPTVCQYRSCCCL